MLKAVILIGGPQKGTRFRPLSLDTPKPLFPIAGVPLIQHHIEACAKLKDCKEILIIGSYTATVMAQFVSDMQKEYHVIIRYLQEFAPLGTGGGLYHFRDQVRAGNPAAFFLLNGDVCADFALKELWMFHSERPEALVTIMGTEATRQQSVHYGCMVRDPTTKAVNHYVEKPNSYVATLINCGVYVCSLQVFNTMASAFERKQDGFYNGNNGQSSPDYMSWEQDVLAPLAGTNKLYAMQVTNWWSQVKTAGSAIYANRHYLELHKHRVSKAAPCQILPDVFIHPTAVVDSTAVEIKQSSSKLGCFLSADRTECVDRIRRDGEGGCANKGVHRVEQRDHTRTRPGHAFCRRSRSVSGRVVASGGLPVGPGSQQAVRQNGQHAAVQFRWPAESLHHYSRCRRSSSRRDDPAQLDSPTAQTPHKKFQARNYFIVYCQFHDHTIKYLSTSSRAVS